MYEYIVFFSIDSIEEEKQVLLDLLSFEEEEHVSVSPSSNIQSAAQIFSNTMKLTPIGWLVVVCVCFRNFFVCFLLLQGTSQLIRFKI